MKAMGLPSSARSAAALAYASPLLALIIVACAQGSSADLDGTGNVDAGALETTPGPSDGDSGTVPQPEPEEDAGKMQDSGPNVSAACLAALDNATFDFEADQDWTHKISDGAQGGPTWPYDPWTRGTATTIACPQAACWAAERTQNYAQCQRGELVSPRIDLSACAGEKISLIFTHAYAFWTGSYGGQTWFDGGIVELSKDDGASWQQPAASYPGTVKINPNQGSSFQCHLANDFHVHNKSGFTGTQTTPSTFEIAIPDNYLTGYVRVRFSQASGVSSQTTIANESRSSTAAGWRIDNVHFAAK
jgi:hypothetical protein